MVVEILLPTVSDIVTMTLGMQVWVALMVFMGGMWVGSEITHQIRAYKSRAKSNPHRKMYDPNFDILVNR